MRKRCLGVLVALIAMTGATLAGCSRATSNTATANSDQATTLSTETETTATVSGTSKLDKIISDGKITIGVNPPGEPICFYDDKGNLIGYDIDWANKLGETLGATVEFVVVDGETRIPAVTSGRVDLIFANITGNLERAKTIDFSIPYLRTGIKMLTAKGSPYKTVDDLNDPKVTVCVGSGTTGEELVLKYAPKANITYVSSWSEQLLSLQEGKCDAVFEDGTTIDYVAGQNKDTLEAQDKVYTSDPICIGYPKNDPELGRYLDMFVSENISNGFQADTYKNWFGTEYTGTLTTIW